MSRSCLSINSRGSFLPWRRVALAWFAAIAGSGVLAPAVYGSDPRAGASAVPKDGLYRGYSKQANHRRVPISFVVRQGRIPLRSYHFRYSGCGGIGDPRPPVSPRVGPDGSLRVTFFGYLNSGRFNSPTRATGFVTIGSRGGRRPACLVNSRWSAHRVGRAR